MPVSRPEVSAAVSTKRPLGVRPRMVPIDRCLIETDSPYLAPVPYRGKVNSPAYVPFVARKLAEVKGLALEEVAERTSGNFERLFPLTVSGDNNTDSSITRA